MAKIIHSEMKRGKGASVSTRPEPETYIVDDFSGENGEETMEISLDEKLAQFESYEQPMEPVEVEKPKPVQKKKSKVLENLILMGRHSQEIEIAEHKFEVSTLTHKENYTIVKRLMNIGDATDLFTIRVLTLAGALKSIDGISMSDIDIGEDFDLSDENDYFNKCVTIVENLQIELVARLYEQYEKILGESKSSVYGDAIKNS